MSDFVFPPATLGPYRLAWSNIKTPEFSTDIAPADSGLETTASKWVFPRWHWKLTYTPLGEAGHAYGDQIQQIIGFFLQRRAAGDTFLFQDPQDYAIARQVIGVTDGVTTDFQTLRNYGGFIEPVYNIQSGTLVVESSTDTVHFTTRTPDASSNGLIHFNTAPSAGWGTLYVTCQFYWRVRFEQD